MKVYVSSTFVDLREYRAAAIRILRQLGHEVVAMENYVADSALPLRKVLNDVESCDAYIGIFAWRYGHRPGRNSNTDSSSSGSGQLPQPGDFYLPPEGTYGKISKIAASGPQHKLIFIGGSVMRC